MYCIEHTLIFVIINASQEKKEEEEDDWSVCIYVQSRNVNGSMYETFFVW